MSDNRRRKANSQMPVSAHPAFPIIIALWFAALLGIGSVVLPLDMFERFALSSGLADMYAGAQPPLGATARIVIAAAGAAIGALVGLFVARKIAAAHAAQAEAGRATPEPEFETDFIKRPISAHEELGEGGLDADTDALTLRSEGGPARRRALTVTDDSASGDFLSVAPLPGRFLEEADEPLDLTAFDDTTPVTAEDGAPTSPEMPPSYAPLTSTQPATAQPGAESPPPLRERALGQLGMVELVERFALALQRHREATVTADAPVAFAPEPSEPEVPADAEETIAALAASDELPAPPANTIPAALRPFSFEDSEADHHEEQDDSLPNLDLTTALLQKHAPATAPGLSPASFDDSGEPEDEIDEEDDAGYPSLLAMKSPFGAPRESIRIEEAGNEDDQPVVSFPVQAVRSTVPADDQPARAEEAAAQVRTPQPLAARADAGETERALREALEKLQRMSGAA